MRPCFSFELLRSRDNAVASSGRAQRISETQSSVFCSSQFATTVFFREVISGLCGRNYSASRRLRSLFGQRPSSRNCFQRCKLRMLNRFDVDHLAFAHASRCVWIDVCKKTRLGRVYKTQISQFEKCRRPFL